MCIRDRGRTPHQRIAGQVDRELQRLAPRHGRQATPSTGSRQLHIAPREQARGQQHAVVSVEHRQSRERERLARATTRHREGVGGFAVVDRISGGLRRLRDMVGEDRAPRERRRDPDRLRTQRRRAETVRRLEDREARGGEAQHRVGGDPVLVAVRPRPDGRVARRRHAGERRLQRGRTLPLRKEGANRRDARRIDRLHHAPLVEGVERDDDGSRAIGERRTRRITDAQRRGATADDGQHTGQRDDREANAGRPEVACHAWERSDRGTTGGRM